MTKEAMHGNSFETKGEEVFRVVCYANRKTCFLYKKLVNRQAKSMGIKNLLDHLKHCVASRGEPYKGASNSGLLSTETSDSGWKPQGILQPWKALLNGTIKDEIHDELLL